jgi:hypothetical protein
MLRMSDTQNTAKTQQSKEYASLALRISAGFCLAFGLFWSWQIDKFSSWIGQTILHLTPYFFVAVHPRRWRAPTIGISLGISLAAAFLAVMASGFAHSREAHVPYLAFAYANLLLFFIALTAVITVRKSVKPMLVTAFVLTGFAYMWMVANL